MRTVWQVFLRDCRRILRNPVAVVVTLGVAMLPSLYAWFNILANWDPYSATGNLQVAVANEDQGTTNDLVGHLDAGRQVVKKLKQNDELGWRFVDNEEQAVHGVETGGYYAAIVLPQGFQHQPGRIGDRNLQTAKNQVLRQREEERDRAENHRHRCHHHRRADQLRLRHHGSHHRCLGRFRSGRRSRPSHRQSPARYDQ